MDYKNLLDKLNKALSKSNLYNLVIIFLVGVLVLVVASFFKSEGSVSKSTMAAAQGEEQEPQSSFSGYEQVKKNELKAMLTGMKGVGRVEVMITFEGGKELVPAVNINDGSSTTKERDNEGGERDTTQVNKGSQVVITNEDGDSKPLILKENNPKVTGVMVGAEGADDKQTQYNIKNAVSVLFGIPSNKVYVYTLKN
jgi:stage III sporulation protein AG